MNKFELILRFLFIEFLLLSIFILMEIVEIFIYAMKKLGKNLSYDWVDEIPERERLLKWIDEYD
jgi:hypothetical protein